MKRWRYVLPTLAAALALAACAVPPVRYYTLAGAPLPSAARPAPAAANASAVHIEIAPVGVPERMARPQMVIRSEDRGDREGETTRLDILEQQRWTSSFDSELRDAFASAIASRAGAVDVTRGGRLPGQPVYRVAIRVRYLDALLDRRVDAGFGWTITRSDDSRSAICQTAVSQPVGAGLDELVRGIQQTVAAAAERIATQLTQLQATGSAGCDPAPPAAQALDAAATASAAPPLAP